MIATAVAWTPEWVSLTIILTVVGSLTALFGGIFILMVAYGAQHGRADLPWESWSETRIKTAELRLREANAQRDHEASEAKKQRAHDEQMLRMQLNLTND